MAVHDAACVPSREEPSRVGDSRPASRPRDEEDVPEGRRRAAGLPDPGAGERVQSLLEIAVSLQVHPAGRILRPWRDREEGGDPRPATRGDAAVTPQGARGRTLGGLRLVPRSPDGTVDRQETRREVS